ncbi:cupin domain-containing protein [Streptomyces sp. NPDC093510]|uniref:cupin domain-containing protein n=1 Tax=Streptomyces sp. NPDC093510 TaxID=3155199 RepID=UPI00342D92FD
MSEAAAQPAAVRTRKPAGPVRKFGRPLAEGVTLNDLVLPRAIGRDMPFTLNTAVVDAGAELPLHSHPQHEIWVVSSGSGVLDRGEETFEIAAGDVVLFESGIEHHLTNNGPVELRLVSVYWGRTA